MTGLTTREIKQYLKHGEMTKAKRKRVLAELKKREARNKRNKRKRRNNYWWNSVLFDYD